MNESLSLTCTSSPHPGLQCRRPYGHSYEHAAPGWTWIDEPCPGCFPGDPDARYRYRCRQHGGEVRLSDVLDGVGDRGEVELRVAAALDIPLEQVAKIVLNIGDQP